MGFGQALGAGIDAWQREDTRQDVMERRDAQDTRAEGAYQQNTAIRDQQMQLSKAKMTEYNDPSSRKLRAETKKAALSQAQLQNDMYALMSDESSAGGNSSASAAQMSNTVTSLEQKVGDQGAVINNDRTWSSVYTDIGSTGQLKDYSQLNTLVKSDPVLSSIIKGDLIKYNPNDDTMKQQLWQLASKQAKMADGKPEDYFPALEQIAKNGVIAFGSQSGTPYDLIGLATMSGANKRLPQSVVDKVNTTISQVGTQASEEWAKSNTAMPASQSSTPGNVPSTQMKPIAGVTPIAPWHVDSQKEKKLYKGKDPQRVADTMKAVGIPVPGEVAQMVKDNAETEKQGTGYWAGASQEQVMEGLDNILTMVEEGGPVTQQMISRAKTGLSSFETADMKNEYSKKLEFAEDSLRVDEIFNEEYDANSKDMKFMENVESQHLNLAGDKSDIGKKRDEVRTDMGLAKELNAAMQEISNMQKDGGMLSGYMADTITEAAAKDPKIIDTIAELTVGDDSPAAIKKADAIRKQVFNTINVKSRVGMILAKYIKSISGSAVSDQEREFLTGVLQGATNGNPKAMATAMQSFRSVLVESSNRTAEDPYYVSMIPSTMYDVKENSDALAIDYASGINEGTAMSREISEGMIKNSSFVPQWMKDVGTGMGNFFTGDKEEKGLKPPVSSNNPSGQSDNYVSQFID